MVHYGFHQPTDGAPRYTDAKSFSFHFIQIIFSTPPTHRGEEPKENNHSCGKSALRPFVSLTLYLGQHTRNISDQHHIQRFSAHFPPFLRRTENVSVYPIISISCAKTSNRSHKFKEYLFQNKKRLEDASEIYILKMITSLCACILPDGKEEETSSFCTKTAKNLPIFLEPTQKRNTSLEVEKKSFTATCKLIVEEDYTPVKEMLGGVVHAAQALKTVGSQSISGLRELNLLKNNGIVPNITMSNMEMLQESIQILSLMKEVKDKYVPAYLVEKKNCKYLALAKEITEEISLHCFEKSDESHHQWLSEVLQISKDIKNSSISEFERLVTQMHILIKRKYPFCEKASISEDMKGKHCNFN
ncbi:hypothetical protein NPIL_677651 [Nephila pilipes]|uniref:Uncharacterized protein n=1 Tax=Nephila pilipes TaxID=299642 RepID=A0A8X6PK33_NEPPI|nr:hypothetical protein NPIL_677651 [Nephila pilipes]